MRIAILLLFVGVSASKADDELPLPGTPVSRPLTPVVEPPQKLPPVEPPSAETPVEPPVVAEAGKPVVIGPIRENWSHYDLLLTWSKAQPVPPLLMGNNDSLLVGGSSLGNKAHAGFRFGMGWASSADREWGFEFEGMFLGTYEATQSFTQGNLNRPFLNTETGRASQLIVNGSGSGGVQVTTTTRVQGWEVTGLKNLVDAGDVIVNALGGYRYFGANEGLHIQQQSLRLANANNPAAIWGIYDQFDARNNFQGGQIGLQFDSVRANWLVSFRATTAFGTNFQTVQATGRSSMTTAALPQPLVQPYNAGFLAVNSNSGRVMQPKFAVLPEARLNVGYRIGGQCHLFAGYDFMYLSNAVRPGDQVDLAVNTAQVPALGGVSGPVFNGANRPVVSFQRTDFWVQGITLGFDCRY
ncbi:hypothetical protein BH11PLA2_BH11PLA2_01430 [soil metagenome]